MWFEMRKTISKAKKSLYCRNRLSASGRPANGKRWLVVPMDEWITALWHHLPGLFLEMVFFVCDWEEGMTEAGCWDSEHRKVSAHYLMTMFVESQMKKRLLSHTFASTITLFPNFTSSTGRKSLTWIELETRRSIGRLHPALSTLTP